MLSFCHASTVAVQTETRTYVTQGPVRRDRPSVHVPFFFFFVGIERTRYNGRALFSTMLQRMASIFVEAVNEACLALATLRLIIWYSC